MCRVVAHFLRYSIEQLVYPFECSRGITNKHSADIEITLLDATFAANQSFGLLFELLIANYNLRADLRQWRTMLNVVTASVIADWFVFCSFVFTDLLLAIESNVDLHPSCAQGFFWLLKGKCAGNVSFGSKSDSEYTRIEKLTLRIECQFDILNCMPFAHSIKHFYESNLQSF